jgi:triphosphoribosyl-dephospho-CoA synthase
MQGCGPSFPSEIIAEAFVAACRDELHAPKPGNVHIFAAGHGMTAAQFEDSAAAAAGPLCAPGARVGARIRGAVGATIKAAGTNTNLGIILLCAPLAAAADSTFAFLAVETEPHVALSSPLLAGERWDPGACSVLADGLPPQASPASRGGQNLRDRLVRVLDDLDVADAIDAFAAIVEASPAGLGRAARHDVFAPPQVTLREAMAEAADRDRVARQYATGYADVFDYGMAVHAAAAARWPKSEFTTLAVYLSFLSRFADSHIVRKHGAESASEVSRTARKFDDLLEAENPVGRWRSHVAEILAWDADLKARGINPGTTADLTVATLFALRLQSVLPSARISG